jgi:UDP-glucuronate 4-epimerase
MSPTVLVTGSAGFIGCNVCSSLLLLGYKVVGIDNYNPYYSTELKKLRVKDLIESSPKHQLWTEYDVSIQDSDELSSIFTLHKPDYVINLAAQAGVRHSLAHPEDYTAINMCGFGNILEQCRKHEVKHLLYASSSSVYGGNNTDQMKESDPLNRPLSLYAASKRANELMAHSYSHLYGLPTTGLRFFTVYGPWGRPDMALFLFTKGILNGTKIRLYNKGNMVRDFTYISDVVEAVIRLLHEIPDIKSNSDICDSSTANSPYEVFNIGSGFSVQLLDYISIIESCLDKKADIDYLDMQPGDVPSTLSVTDKLFSKVGWRPSINVNEGVANFVSWYLKYQNFLSTL